MIRAHRDKDFRTHAVFPTADLEDCKLVIIRADYVMETVTVARLGPVDINLAWAHGPPGAPRGRERWFGA